MKKLEKRFQFIVDLYKSKKLTEAEKLCRELIKLNPKLVIAYNLLGLILSGQKKTAEAIDIYKKGINLEPKFSIIYNNLGSVYKSLNNLVEAEQNYKKSIEINNKIPEPYNNLGNLYKLLDKHEDSIKCYEKAIKIDPKFYWAFYNLGIENITLGRFSEAKINLKKTIELNKYFSSAHRALSRLIKYDFNNEHLKQMLDIYNENKLNDFQKTDLAFALGKAHEDISNYKDSFKFYDDGNKLYRRNVNFSLDDEKKEFKKIKKIFNKELFIKAKNKGNNDNSPIFVLGMPRSGTTLVEQIISSHESVFGADELNYIPDMIKENFSNFINEQVSINNIENIGQLYIDKIKKISNNTRKVTDKLPINFKWIGFIKLILPNAKIIHCNRNSKDIIFSIFKNYFTNPSFNFAYNLEDIVYYFNLYKDLMNHWNNLFPNSIINVNYEEIIKNPENQIRHLIKSCELAWDDKCLSFYENKRPIKTASDIQARNKIYSSSVNSWKNYETYLNNFFKNLDV